MLPQPMDPNKALAILNERLTEEATVAAEQLAELLESDRVKMAQWALQQARRKQAAGQHDATAHFTMEGGRMVGYLDIYDDGEEGTPMRCVPHPAWNKSLPREGEEWLIVCAGGTTDGFIMALPVFNSRWN